MLGLFGREGFFCVVVGGGGVGLFVLFPKIIYSIIIQVAVFMYCWVLFFLL